MAGPGCSSLGAGAFSEHGPFHPSGDARDNFNFLHKWLAKFPEFRSTKFFITGESYAGHYVPQLANLIIQSKPKLLNLTGIAIGNPLLEFNTDLNSGAEYLWSHGLISDFTYNQLTFVCNFSQIRRQYDAGKLTPKCSRVDNQVSSEISRFVDAYDVTLDVCFSSGVSLQSQSLYKLQDEPKIDVCIGDETGVYLNREEVQKALHAQLIGVKEWSFCSDVVNYDMRNLEIPTNDILGELVKSGIRVLVYSGDQDSVIPLTGTRKVINDLANRFKLKTTRPYRPWIVRNQVAGWTQAYGELLTYATIRGASHEAPFTQPERSLLLFTSLLHGNPLPPINGTK
ncbi:serine carboxypeptidase-like 45 [Phtheirospermum japonicum]|uniref:Carboxypeptidase n=1 Tax=Phtheirospermum japonicum TaxID=374723 RepID=A0A830BM99_9LAMI|nr:serine carboxypeptidase-like 45 [Phtheirospermum japonicum]